MKPFIVICFFFFFQSSLEAQVVFCAKGAEWNYLFNGSIFSPGNTYNETIKYEGDTIDGQDTVKILSHNRFYLACGSYVWPRQTLLKQKADTIFFKNSLTSGTWQILYNFAALPGQSWTTTTQKGYTITETFTTTVNSVTTVTINGLALKQLNVSSTSKWYSPVITERLGSSLFLFNLSLGHVSSCDGDWLLENLCYRDSTFGLLQYGEHSCYYYTVNSTGIFKEEMQLNFEMYPVPANELINLNFNRVLKNPEIQISDIQGRLISKQTINKSTDCYSIDISELKSGLYYLNMFENGKWIGSNKLVKE